MIDNAAPAALLFFAGAPETSKAVMTQSWCGCLSHGHASSL